MASGSTKDMILLKENLVDGGIREVQNNDVDSSSTDYELNSQLMKLTIEVEYDCGTLPAFSDPASNPSLKPVKSYDRFFSKPAVTDFVSTDAAGKYYCEPGQFLVELTGS